MGETTPLEEKARVTEPALPLALDNAPPSQATPASRRAADPRSAPPVHPVGLLQAAQSLLTVLIVALFLMTFTVQPIRIPSASMEPTLLIGDFLLLDKQATGARTPWWMPPAGIARGDVVVFHDPVDDPSIHLIKRVVGVPGDRIRLLGGQLERNGDQIREDYAVHRPTAPDAYRDEFPDLRVVDPRVNPNWWIRLQSLAKNGAITVPEGSYFVLGDNRNDSEDSRYWGFVPASAIVGQPVVIYFSWREEGRNDSQEEGREGSGLAGSRDSPVSGPMRAAGLEVLPAKATHFARWERIFQRVR